MPPGGFWQYDKLAHGAVYGVLALLFYRAFCFHTTRTSRLAAGLAMVSALVYGISDEWHQSFVPGRFPSALDVLADGIGAAVFVGVAFVVRRYRKSMHDLQ